MAESKRPSSTKKPAAAAEPPASSKAQGIDPKAVYVGGESLADRLLPHAKKIFLTLGAIAIVLTAYFTYEWWSRNKKEKATTKLLDALEEFRREVKEPSETPDEPDPDLPPPPKTFATEAERTDATLAALSHVTGSHRTMVALFEAKMLLAADRTTDAEALYVKTSSAKGLEGVLAREGLAYTAEQAALALEPGDARNAALQKALELYRTAQPEEDGPRHDVMLYNEGRLLALLGDKGAARDAFAKAKEQAGEDLKTTIEVRISQLDAKDLPMVPAPHDPAPPPTEPEQTPPAETTDGGAAAPPATPDAGN